MRAAFRFVVTVIGISAAVLTGPAGVSHAATNTSPGLVISSVLPSRGQVVGVAHPVVVKLGKPVATEAGRRVAERALRVTSKPPMTGKFDWLGNDTVQWVPDRFWPAHGTVKLAVGELTTEFDTGPAVVGVANITDHTFTVTVDGVETGPPSSSPGSLPAPHHRPHWGEQGVMPATMGRPEYPTPPGTYTVQAKQRTVIMDSSSVGIPVSDPDGYRIPVDYAVRINGPGLYVHSAPWAVNAMGIDNVSHGCISLSPDDAEWYYNTVNVGDPVIVAQ